MAIKDAPDGTLWVQNVTVVVDTPTAPAPANETPIAVIDRYSGVDTDYQEVCSWTVTASKTGILKEVSMTSDELDKTYFKLEIGGSTIFEDVMIGQAIALPFPDLALDGDDEVKLSAKSSDGTNITVDGSITGKEVG
jgi:hypothetical protein